jgi:capsular polysaccharide transport system permease protein
VAKKAAANAADKIVVQPTVRKASRQGRHWMILFSFLMLVGLPSAVTGWYLWERAVDQYASFVGFSVRTEEKGSAIELLGSVTDLSGSSSTDTDILFEFLQSQELVAAIDEKLDLRSIWSKADPQVDPVFAYHPPGTIEDLVDHWDRMVKVYYDSGTGLIDLRVLAFDPVDATTIATEIYARANARINELSAVAREDAIGYAREELAQAEDRLRQARIDIQAFRNRTQIIDPTIQTQTQSGLIGALETQLAEAQIERRLLEETARKGDPRITQSELKIDVIRAQIAEERGKLGLETADGVSSVADLVGEYEALAVDLEFAQQAYTAARATFDASRNEARRQSRYLAAHVTPTKAEQAKYPERPVILGLISMFLFLTWSVVVLVAYALRDRR